MKPLLLQNQFTEGQKSDFSRNRMPPNSAWALKDIILDLAFLGARARRVGERVPFLDRLRLHRRRDLRDLLPDGRVAPEELFIDSTGAAYSFDTTSTTSLGAAVTVLQNPVFHGGVAASAASAIYTGLVIIPDVPGAAQKFDGTTSPTSTDRQCPVRRRLQGLHPPGERPRRDVRPSRTRVWFSRRATPTARHFAASPPDTTDSWIDFSLPVRGLAADEEPSSSSSGTARSPASEATPRRRTRT